MNPDPWIEIPAFRLGELSLLCPSVRGLEPCTCPAQLVPLSVIGAPATLTKPGVYPLSCPVQGTRDAELEARPWASDCALGLRVEYSNGCNMGGEAMVEWHQMRVDRPSPPSAGSSEPFS